MKALIPSEWTAALGSYREIRRIALLADSSLSSAVSFLVPFAIGAIFVTTLSGSITLPNDAGFLSGIVAVLSGVSTLIAGFVIAIMLFLGGFKIPAGASFEEHNNFVEKLKYMLFSQCATLLAAVMMLIFSAAWYFLRGLDDEIADSALLGATAGGFSFVTVLRFVTLPLQIFELNEAQLEESLSNKEKELAERYSSDR